MRAGDTIPESRKWWTLAALCFPLAMVMLNTTAGNVALPSIQRSLNMGLSELEWVMNAFGLGLALFMLTGGKLADHYGRRRMLVLGLLVFTISSLVCGLATESGLLIGARAVQGLGAALMMPSTLSIIVVSFPARERGTAFGVWTGVSGAALAGGPLVGGVLTQHIDWSWIFYVNVPLGAVAIACALILVPESRDESPEGRLDLLGLVTVGLGLFALTFALVEGNSYGWTSWRILASLAASIVLLAGFVVLEARQRLPMLDLSLFRSRTFVGANIVVLLFSLGILGTFFFISVYMQEVLGYSPVRAGAAFLPMTVLLVLLAPISGRLADRVGSRWLLAGGMTMLGCSLLLFSRVDVDTGFWVLLPALLVGGVGWGTTPPPANTAVLSAVSVHKAGVGAGVLNTFRLIGSPIGIALMGAVIGMFVDVLPNDPAFAQRYVEGLQLALYVTAGIAFAGAVAAAALIRRNELPGAPVGSPVPAS